MSISKIEYPTLDITRTAAIMQFGEVREKTMPDTGDTVFMSIEPSVDGSRTHKLTVVGFWSARSNYGVIYNSPATEVKQ